MLIIYLVSWLSLVLPFVLAERKYELYPGERDPMLYNDYITIGFLRKHRRHRVNYWIRAYLGPNCTKPMDPKSGFVSNFGCTGKCWAIGPTQGIKSILIEAPWCQEPGLEYSFEETRRVWSQGHFISPYINLAKHGPVVVAFRKNPHSHKAGCNSENMIKRLVIPRKMGLFDHCHTFDGAKPTHFDLKLPRACDPGHINTMKPDEKTMDNTPIDWEGWDKSPPEVKPIKANPDDERIKVFHENDDAREGSGEQVHEQSADTEQTNGQETKTETEGDDREMLELSDESYQMW
ncbi:hypothetical protein QQS21_008903 [Conoideocrella luteorostrata]|uniref:Uncharacterized protein n=1 Tax=Conoideocrella luteorostrata TaxID=1105319 RepID=A0AAJ0CIS7_9HYPO|nr:hypothetical protein QQS21_008903 [Conoideocrella luteorostrata]